MTLDESYEVLQRVFGYDAALRGDLPWQEYCKSLAKIAALQAERLQDMQNQIDRLERDVAALEGRSE